MKLFEKNFLFCDLIEAIDRFSGEGARKVELSNVERLDVSAWSVDEVLRNVDLHLAIAFVNNLEYMCYNWFCKY